MLKINSYYFATTRPIEMNKIFYRKDSLSFIVIGMKQIYNISI